MRSKNLLFLSLLLLGAAFPLFMGCDRPSLLPAPLTPQVVWANGSIGTWFTNALTANPGGSTTASIVAVTDPISGDGNTLRLTTTSTNGFYYLSAAVTENPFNYYYTGNLQFDIRLEQAPSNITAMNIQYVNYSGSGNYAEYVFSTNLINSLSTSAFTHLSLPFRSFTTGNGYIETSVDTPFQISWTATGSGTAITLDNIQWTSN